MDIVYFTLTAAALYFVSDRLLEALERRAGRRFEQRSLIFFVIILTLSMVTFSALRHALGA